MVDGGGGGKGGVATDKSQSKRRTYSILYSNVRSTLNKLDEFRAYICECNPDIILLCDTFVRPYICDALLALAGYEMVVRKDGGTLWREGAGGCLYTTR